MLKKRISILITTAAIAVAATIGGTNAFAAGTGTQNISSPATVNNGADASFTVSLSGLSGVGGGGVQGYNGTFVFDSAYWTYKSFTSKAPFGISFNEANGKFIGAGMSPFAATSSDMFTIVLTAKQTGTTSISMTSTKVVDGNGDTVTTTAAAAQSVTITNAPVLSTNNNLSALSVSGYTITPAFSAGTTSYTLTVPFTASSVTVNATKADSAATMTGAGTKTLTVGNNTVNVVVTSESGSSKTYTIVITREADTTTPPPTQSSDATLKSLSVSGYTLTPSFNKNTTNYSITVPESIKGLNVTAVPTDSKATAVVSGNTGWGAGTSNITIKVTAENGSVKTYIVTVKRPGDTDSNKKSSNNYLKSLNIKTYPIKFDKNTNNYALTVPYEVEKLNISAVAENSKAKIEIINNNELKVGELNVIEILVTAEDGSLRIYTLNVTRSSIASKTKLASLEVKNHEISPKFDPEVEEYSLTVPYSVTDLDVIYKTSDKDAKVSIMGDKNLKQGNNVVLVKVTDANGFTRTYIINVEREAGWTILGMSPLLFFSLLGLLLALILFIIFLLFKRRKNKAETPAESHDININVNPSFTPDVNVGSKNDSDFATGNARVIRGNSNDTDDKRRIIEGEPTDAIEAETSPFYDSSDSLLDDDMNGDFMDALMSSLKVGMDNENASDKYDLDDLMHALKTRDGNKVKLFIKQVKADDLKDELRGLDPDRFDDIFDDHPTVHEVVRAIEEWHQTGKSKKLALLVNQYEAEQLQRKTGRDETDISDVKSSRRRK